MKPWLSGQTYWVSLGILVLVTVGDIGDCCGQEEEATPPFLSSYIALTRQLDELHETATTLRFKVDGERLAQAYNQRLAEDMEKSFVLVVQDLDVDRQGRVRIEFSEIEGISEDVRNRVGFSSWAIVVSMDEDEAYRVERGSRVRVLGKPRLLFRPGSIVRKGRAFQDSVIAGWKAGEHSCYLLFSEGRGSLVFD